MIILHMKKDMINLQNFQVIVSLIIMQSTMTIGQDVIVKII